eukprot:TRINITY_DN5551_c0_g1_i1.p1 TRINITY_DN5551_c0_g1~~TRINITY_DN5551_c0_g1_i1.p1  ORF type:complete len:433 (+),score=91.53 TRINITY_DN5551_c0_g1_i1:141-1439(+)
MENSCVNISAVEEELKSVNERLFKCAESEKNEESLIVRLLLSQQGKLERKLEEEKHKLEQEKMERKLEEAIQEKHQNIRALFLGEKDENDSYAKLLKEEIEELQRRLARMWDSRSGMGAQQELPSSMRTQLDKIEEVQAQILQVLQSEQVLKVNISQPRSGIQDALVRLVGLSSIVEGDVETSEPGGVQFQPFQWPQGDEEKDSADPCKHFQKQLGMFGVKFGRGWWKLLDVRNEKLFLSTRLGNIVLSGTTDAVIVPFKVAREGAPLQIRVVLEWKVPQYSQWNLCKGQGFLELIAAYARSRSPLIVVVTDLQSKFHILEPWLGESGDVCIAQFPDMDPRQAMLKIAGFLATVSLSPGYNLERDVGTAESACACFSKKIKDAIPENPLAEVLGLVDFLPPCEREQLIWEVVGSQNFLSCDSEVPTPISMYV